MNYYLYIFSHLASIVAFRSTTVAIIWALVQSFGQSENIGFLVAIMWITNIFFLPISGFLLDIYSKKTIILVSIFGSLVASILLSYNYESLISCIIFVSILSAFNSAISAAPNSIIPLLIEKEGLTKAIGLSSTLNSLQVIIGVVIGGGVIYAIGVEISLYVTTALYLTSLILILLMSFPKKSTDFGGAHNKALQLTQGFRSIKNLKPEVIFCLSAMVGNFILTPLVSIIIPIYVLRELNNNVGYVVLFESAIAIGMILGGTISIKATTIFNRYHQVLFGGCLIGLGVFAFATFEEAYIKVFSLFCSGMGLTIKGIPFSSLRGHAVPHEYKARIESAIFMLCILSIPIGSLTFSYILDNTQLDINNLVRVMGGLIILSLTFIIFSKESVQALQQNDDTLEHYYTQHYPKAFR
ncbi:MFS transporter [Vibrio sp. FF59]|uniref:Permease, putative n=1 Tax=Vibrio tasmaniensis TaxID=212663 RepID=A0A0H3ZUF1_9VIBR|nr:permease, putative [Vibrio tasmaniensis]